MPHELVSVIIPAYNAESFVSDAIASVLNQSYQPVEIIVIDDGSTDATQKKVQAFGHKVKCIQQQNKGISSARNAGLAIAQGTFIAFLDADDVWLPTKLEKQIEYVRLHPDVKIVFCQAKNTFKPDLVDPLGSSEFPVIDACIPDTCFFRHELLTQIGLFDTEVKLGEFADWYGRIVNLKIKIGMVKELLVLRRIHGNNIGIRQRQLATEYVRVLKRKIDAAKVDDRST